MKLIEKNSEIILLEYVNNLKTDNSGFRSIVFNLSKLSNENKSNFQLKIVSNLIGSILGNKESTLFICKDSDMILIFRDEENELTNKIIEQTRYLFQRDAIAYFSNKRENPNFAFSYNLLFQWRDFYIFCKKKSDDRSGKQKQNKQADHHLKSIDLIEIEKGLDELEIERSLRLKPVYLFSNKLAKNGHSVGFKKIFHEIYVKTSHLKNILVTDNEEMDETLYNNPIVIEKLNYRLLAMLEAKAKSYKPGTISLNLLSDNILSQDFDHFHNMLATIEKISIIIEMNVAEYFQNFNKFLEAKNKLNRLNYKICLTGVNFSNFFQINRSKLGFNLLKITWDDHFLDSDFDISEIQQAIELNDPKRIILTNVQTQDVLDLAASMNISIFEGLHINSVVKKIENEENVFA